MPREFIAQGDRVVVLGSISGKVKATGRPFKSDWIHLFTVRDGMVVSFQDNFDTAIMAKAYHATVSA